MSKVTCKFKSATCDIYHDAKFSQLRKISAVGATVLITDEHVYSAHPAKFRGWNTIVLKPGEEYKIQATADAVINKLLEMEAGRDITLVGVGGGVITDLTGYVASIYLRGVRFGFVPTTILAMVDAAIGGKNGIDVDVYKNMVGVIRQPAFILYDLSFAATLPVVQWENGFAEIIKHACIRDAAMFGQLEKNDIEYYRKNKKAFRELVQRNAQIKISVVKRDEFEKNERRLLNFGHTLGHALENQYELLHGQAISIGMTAACHISEQILAFKDTKRITAMLEQFNLPAYALYNPKKVFGILRKDKKRSGKEMNFVLLEKIGKGVIRQVSMRRVEQIINDL